MSNFDLEFASARRNRNAWPNPCLFEVPITGVGQRGDDLNALDPVSDQTPVVRWVGKRISKVVEIVASTASSVVVAIPKNGEASQQTDNYYRGSQLKNFRVDSSVHLSTASSTDDYVQLNVSRSNLQLKDKVLLNVSEVPGTMYVPTGMDVSNAYVGYYLCNDTRGGAVVVTGYDSEFHKATADIPDSWEINDTYNIRPKLPVVERYPCDGTTLTTVSLGSSSPFDVTTGEYLRIVETNEVVVVAKFENGLATVSPKLSASFPSGTLVDVLKVTGDNFKTMSYSIATSRQREQASYEIQLVSGTIPNVLLAEKGGYPSDYPFLYVEFYDTNLPNQNMLFSNGHSNKSYFKVTTPTGQVLDRKERFTKVTGDLNHKIIRIGSNANFRVSWRLPCGTVMKFKESDALSPNYPNDMLQTSVMFSLRRV